MSATGRGRERLADDAYLTPVWCVDRILEKLPLPKGLWLEPCAGEGAIIGSVISQIEGVDFAACELREECLPQLMNLGFDKGSIHDFLTLDTRKMNRFAVGITNPPYTNAFEILEQMLRCCDNVVLLLRINFLGSEERAPWLSQHMPDVYQLPNRPSFKVFVSDIYFCEVCKKEKAVPEGSRAPFCSICGGTTKYKGQKKSSSDATEYAWMHWPGAGVRTEGKVTMLNTTPKSQRLLTAPVKKIVVPKVKVPRRMKKAA